MGAATAVGRATNKALARGTLAPQFGEQAAEGLTARLSHGPAPHGEPNGELAPSLKRSQQC